MNKTLNRNPSLNDAVTYKLFIEGKALRKKINLLSLTIKKKVNRIPSAKIVIREGKSSRKRFLSSNKKDFVPGKSIKIHIGRNSDNKQVFEGIIVRTTMKVKDDGRELHIDCQDEAVKMTLGRRSKYFTEETDSQVFKELINEYKGLRGYFDSTNLKGCSCWMRIQGKPQFIHIFGQISFTSILVEHPTEGPELSRFKHRLLWKIENIHGILLVLVPVYQFVDDVIIGLKW